MKVFEGTPGNDLHEGTERKMLGGAGNDRLDRDPTVGPYGQEIEPEGVGHLFGEAGNDQLFSYWFKDRLFGGDGDDVLVGNKLSGGGGRDEFTGVWSGDIAIHADGSFGPADDSYKARMVGGNGKDTFIIDTEMTTRLPDFRSGRDKIVVIDRWFADFYSNERVDYDRKTGVLTYDYDDRNYTDIDREVIARLDPGTKVKAGDLDLVLL